MACIPRPKLNKIPGSVLPLAKRESYVKNLTELTQIELLEIKEREQKLLQNKSKLNKLPDKGKRIQDFYDKVLTELERRANVDDAAKMFSNLNIAAKGEKVLNKLEWQGKLNNFQDIDDPLEDVLDSDDEAEISPLRVLAQRQMHERKIKVEQPDWKVITADDLKEIESFKSDSSISGFPSESETKVCQELGTLEANNIATDFKENLDSVDQKLESLNKSLSSDTTGSISSGSCSHSLDLEPHVHYLVDKTETHVQSPAKEKFRPYRTTVSNVHDPIKERQRKKGKHWEVTAATPPPIQHNGTQILSLMDSVEIQRQYLLKLKEIQEKLSTERLAAKLKRLDNPKINLPVEEDLKTKASFTNYRNSSSKGAIYYIEGKQKINQDDEIHDPLDEEQFGGINYTIYK